MGLDRRRQAELGPRLGLLVFGLAVIGLATFLTLAFIADTLPWAHQEKPMTASSRSARLVSSKNSSMR